MAIHVHSDPGRVTIELTGLSKLAAMRRRFELDAARITSVSVRPRTEVDFFVGYDY